MKRSFSLSVALLVLTSLVLPAVAQQLPAPALMVKQEDKTVPLGVEKVIAEARIHGPVAETTLTMTFRNDTSRNLAGDLYFPLPPGATVAGYALDIKDRMVPGVAIEKHRARIAFEKEVRKGVDPGLAEYVKGNMFRTRVFPIPPKGTRRVRVRYVSEITEDPQGANLYRLPMNFEGKIKQFHLRMEVVKPADEPKVVDSRLANFAFKKWRDGYLAETKLTDAELPDHLTVALPEVPSRTVLTETASDGSAYFAIVERPKLSIDRDRRPAPRKVLVLWDASGSRAKVDRAKELQIIEKMFAQWAESIGEEHPACAVDLVVFRDRTETPVRFSLTKYNPEKLIAHIRTLKYDGGSAVPHLQYGNRYRKRLGAQVTLAFTDGMFNFGDTHRTAGSEGRVIAIASGTSVDMPRLRRLTGHTGGMAFHLDSTTPEQIAAQSQSAPVLCIPAPADSKSDKLRLGPEYLPGAGRVVVTGRIDDGNPRKVKLTYRRGSERLAERTHTINPAGAAEGDLLRILYAQQRLDDLMADTEANRNAIVELGKTHSLATPHTSLLVLETLDQYVEHRVQPPAELPDMRKQWTKRMDTIENQRKQAERKQIEAVVALWKTRLEWYKKEFKYPKDFKYNQPSTQPRLMAGGGEQRGESGNGSANAPTPEATTDLPASGLFGSSGESDTGEDGGSSLFGSETSDGPDTKDRSISLAKWDPKTPYLDSLKKADADKQFTLYLAQKQKYGNSPAFYLDCADFFAESDKLLALQILSNIAEMQLDSPAVLRILAHRLAQWNHLDLAIEMFEQVLALRPEEPQSYRDLALVLSKKARQREIFLKRARMSAEAHRRELEQIRAAYGRALELLNEVVMRRWDRFDEIELIALTEANAILADAKAAGLDEKEIPLDKRLRDLLSFDVRIVLSWDADMTDMDLHVTEPSGERAFYGHNRTTIGGLVSRDFTRGYGPEEYLLRNAMPGKYKVAVKYYGSSQASLQGAVTIQVQIITDYGKETENRRTVTRRLTGSGEMIDIGKVEVK